MVIDKRTYRNPNRRIFLCLGFLLLAAFLGSGAAFATGGARIAFALLAGLVAALGLRTLFLRLVATGSGLRVHGLLGNRTYAWSEMERIELGNDPVNSMNPLQVFHQQWIPVAHLTSGRMLKLTEITSYTMRKSARDTTLAARVARELELARAAAR
ncbi:PH domain-containing protein [Dactylosporangium sp. NPDC049140]|uniref:PH domain-containing protein n=1 Tax=Dactylosporangium sp. NPDC049140 TaxID=3155647 RepID=UPI0033F533C8